MSRRVRTSQLSLPAPRTWGGRRKGSGRKRRRARAGVPHRARPALAARFPVHVTIRLRSGLPSLRRRELFRQLQRQFVRARKAGFRVCQFSVQRNHVHLICEAADATALSRGMMGFQSGVARRINTVLGRSGRVFDDRYHAQPLRSPLQVRHALCYVLHNTRRHDPYVQRPRGWVDPHSSGPWFTGWATALPPPDTPSPVATPHTWLLREAWQRHGPIGLAEMPAPGRA